jgi:SAM-dependent methyltransferase
MSILESAPDPTAKMVQKYVRRGSFWHRLLSPPLPLILNGGERLLPQCSGVKLFIGGAGSAPSKEFINIDLTPFPGVHLVTDIEAMPFADGSVSAIECDAVLEHVAVPSRAVGELARTLRPGGFLHVVVPFCHPFHEYPRDYQRWTLDGLRKLLEGLEIIDIGIRTGPTATLLAFMLEYVKLISPGPLKKPAYMAVSWIVWPLRCLDLYLNRKAGAQILANHIYALARKPDRVHEN